MENIDIRDEFKITKDSSQTHVVNVLDSLSSVLNADVVGYYTATYNRFFCLEHWPSDHPKNDSFEVCHGDKYENYPTCFACGETLDTAIHNPKLGARK